MCWSLQWAVSVHIDAAPSRSREAGGRLAFHRCISTAPELFLAEIRAEIEDAFGGPLINLYAATEVSVIALSYRRSTGLHRNEDNCGL